MSDSFENGDDSDISSMDSDLLTPPSSNGDCEDDKRKINQRIVIFLLFLVVLSVFVMAVSVIFLIGIMTSINYKDEVGGDIGENHLHYHIYQYTLQDKNTKIITHGKQTLIEHLDHSQFLSYKDQNGNDMLISNIGEKEFKCTGTCFCDDGRRSSQVVSRGISYLLIAASSVFAYKIASDNFKEECVAALSESDCKEESIQSEVESCEDFVDAIGKQKKNLNTYSCIGHCIVNTYDSIPDPNDRLNPFGHVDCGQFRTDAYFDLKKGQDPITEEITAMKIFVKKFLQPYCALQQPISYFFKDPEKPLETVTFEDPKEDNYFPCLSIREDLYGRIGETKQNGNPTIKCKKFSWKTDFDEIDENSDKY